MGLEQVYGYGVAQEWKGPVTLAVRGRSCLLEQKRSGCAKHDRNPLQVYGKGGREKRVQIVSGVF